MMMKAVLFAACIVLAVYGQAKQGMVGTPGAGMQICGTTYCPVGQMCSYQSGFPQCIYAGNGGMYPGNGGMYPGMYPGIGGMYPGMGSVYPGVGVGMAMTVDERPATAPRGGDAESATTSEVATGEEKPTDITESL